MEVVPSLVNAPAPLVTQTPAVPELPLSLSITATAEPADVVVIEVCSTPDTASWAEILAPTAVTPVQRRQTNPHANVFPARARDSVKVCPEVMGAVMIAVEGQPAFELADVCAVYVTLVPPEAANVDALLRFEHRMTRKSPLATVMLAVFGVVVVFQVLPTIPATATAIRTR